MFPAVGLPAVTTYPSPEACSSGGGANCTAFSGADLTVEQVSPTDFRVKASVTLLRFTNSQDAQDAVKVLKRYNRFCRVGVYAGYDPLYVTHWQAVV